MIILEIITFIFILSFYNPINQVKEHLLKTYLPSIVIDSNINMETIFKEVKGEIANGSMLIRNDVLFSESLQGPFKLSENVTGSSIMTNSIISDTIQGILKLIYEEIANIDDRLRNNIYQQSDFQKDDEHSDERTLYNISKSTGPAIDEIPRWEMHTRICSCSTRKILN